MTNRLAQETSPYLLQHAENPVDWYPWGPEASARAVAEDKPVLLSSGYAACHWCHVMAHESFENELLAAYMNSRFINIKVDREERPDVDAIYMTALQSLSGHGGWPLTMFLLPNGEPFYGGTYFPPDDRDGMLGFDKVLKSVVEAFTRQREGLEQTGQKLMEAIQTQQDMLSEPEALTEATLDMAITAILATHDKQHGGFGGRPKFPQALAIEVLLRAALRKHDRQALLVAEESLEAMARGGIYDQLGGGFHRYSVDEGWRVPHFEKMLYDNALLARVYLLAYQATHKVIYEVIATEVLDYVARELMGPEGQFYASQDADSDGIEGQFFVWTHAEILEALGVEDGRLFASVYGVSPEGNFEEGLNILHLSESWGEVAKRERVTLDRLTEAISRGRAELFARRLARAKPARDEKALASWNGLMLQAFALGAAVLSRPDYLAIAEANAQFTREKLHVEGRLMRSYKDGRASIPGFLEDYANVAGGQLALYEASLRPIWLEAAIATARAMGAAFEDPEGGAFFDTASHHEQLIARPRELFDNATPSGNASAAEVLLRLARLTGDATFERQATAILAGAGQVMRRYPVGAGRMLASLDFRLAPPREVVLVGPPSSDEMEAFRSGLFYRYRPYLLVAGGGESDCQRLAPAVPLLANRTPINNRPAAYLCERHTCLAPFTDAAQLLDALDRA